MIIGMIANLMTFRHHSLQLCLIAGTTFTDYIEGCLAAVLCQTIHDPVSNRRIRTIIER